MRNAAFLLRSAIASVLTVAKQMAAHVALDITARLADNARKVLED